MISARHARVPHRRSPLLVVLLCLAILIPALPPQPAAASPGLNQPEPPTAPDASGPLIAFRRDGNVWLMRVDGSDQRQLTTDGTHTSLDNPASSPYAMYQWHSWSPDGAHLLMVRDTHLGQGGSSRDFFLYDVASDSVRLLKSGVEANPFQPAWATDANQIAYVSEEGDIYGDWQPLDVTSVVDRIDLDGTSLGKTTVANRRTIPPEILYFMSPSLELWYRENLVSFYSILPAIQWSTDSDRALFYTGAGAIVEVTWSTGMSQLLEPGDPSLMEDGTISGRVSALAEGATSDSVRPEGDYFGPVVAWYPDRSRYLFVTNEIIADSRSLSPSDASVDWDRYLMDRHTVLWSAGADGNALQRLHEADGYAFGLPSVSPDASVAVFSEIENPTDLWNNRLPGDLYNRDIQETYAPGINVRKLDLATGETAILAENAGRPVIQPGSVVAGHSEPAPASEKTEGWQSSGDLIAFLRDGNVWVANVDGSDARELTTDGEAEVNMFGFPSDFQESDPVFYPGFSWSPDGRYLAITRDAPSRLREILLYDAQNGELSTLLTGIHWAAYLPAWATDASELLVPHGDREFAEPGGRVELLRVTPDGSVSAAPSFENGRPICGLPSGLSILPSDTLTLRETSVLRDMVDPSFQWSAADNRVLINRWCYAPQWLDLATGEQTPVLLPGEDTTISQRGPGSLLLRPDDTSQGIAIGLPMFSTPIDVQLFSMDSSSLETIASGLLAVWSPDGERIVLSRTTVIAEHEVTSPESSWPLTENSTTLHEVAPNGSSERLITELPVFGIGWPSISHDGEWLIVSAVENPTEAIANIPPGGQVSEAWVEAYPPAVNLYRVNITTGETELVVENGGWAKAQPAGSHTPEQADHPGEGTNVPEPAGEPVAGTQPSSQNVDLTKLTPDPDAPATEASGSGAIHLKPGSDWIAYVGEDANIWLMKPDGSQQTQITTDGSMEHSQPVWSPDGTILVFTRHLSPDAGIMVYRDGTLTQVPNSSLCGPVAITLDNSRLLYSCAGREDYETEPTAAQLASDPQLAAIASSNLDGTDARVLVSYTLPSTGQNGVIWVDSGAVGFNGLSDLAVNPSTGEILASFSFLHSMTAWLVEPSGAPTLTEIPFSDHNQDRLGPFSAEFLPGSEQIVALVCEQGCYPGLLEQVRSILILNRDGSTAQRLIGSDTAPGLGSFTVSPDATTLMYSTYSTGGDVPSMIWSMPIGEDPTPLLPGSNPAWQPNPGVTPQAPVSRSDSQTTQPSGSSGTSGESTTVPDTFLGTWSGLGIQVNPSVDWPVTIDLTGGVPGAVVGTSTYPDDGCGGNLVLQSATVDTIVLVEHLTYGLDACTDGGTITLGLTSDSTLSFEWAGVRTDGSASSASGTLHRPESTPGAASEQATTQDGGQSTEGPAIDTTQLNPWYIGTFSGAGQQENPDIEWPITITFAGGGPGEVVGTVEYPTLGCGGELVLVSIDPNDEWLGFEAIEHLTYGHDNCIDGGTFTFSNESATGIAFHWTSPASDTRARGNLPRVEPSAVVPADQLPAAGGDAQVIAPVTGASSTEGEAETIASGGGPPLIHEAPAGEQIVPIEPDGG